MLPAGGLAFGPFQLEPRARRLLRDRVEVPLPVRYFDVLHLLASRAGETIAKDELIAAIWPSQPIDDNSLSQAVSKIRSTLASTSPDLYIVTEKGRGYRFAAEVTRVEPATSNTGADAVLAPHLAMLDGRAQIETLTAPEIARARVAFAELVQRHPGDARFRVGLASACAYVFEATRCGANPDRAVLDEGLGHAIRACELDEKRAEAWAVRGFLLDKLGKSREAQAALLEAIRLEGSNWRHRLRLGSASWGEARLTEAREAQRLFMRDLPIARVMVATVFIARDALDEAERELDCGLAVIARDPTARQPLTTSSIHWLKGLLCLVREDDVEARRMFDEELALEPSGRLYATECCANAWYAIGARHLQQGESAAARTAFGEALQRMPRLAMAHAGMALLLPTAERPSRFDVPTLPDAPPSIDATLARAALMVADGKVAGAAAMVAAALDALGDQPAGNAGWLIPVDPLLGVSRARDAWAGVLMRLGERAK